MDYASPPSKLISCMRPASEASFARWSASRLLAVPSFATFSLSCCTYNVKRQYEHSAFGGRLNLCAQLPRTAEPVHRMTLNAFSGQGVCNNLSGQGMQAAGREFTRAPIGRTKNLSASRSCCSNLPAAASSANCENALQHPHRHPQPPRHLPLAAGLLLHRRMLTAARPLHTHGKLL